MSHHDDNDFNPRLTDVALRFISTDFDADAAAVAAATPETLELVLLEHPDVWEELESSEEHPRVRDDLVSTLAVMPLRSSWGYAVACRMLSAMGSLIPPYEPEAVLESVVRYISVYQAFCIQLLTWASDRKVDAFDSDALNGLLSEEHEVANLMLYLRYIDLPLCTLAIISTYAGDPSRAYCNILADTTDGRPLTRAAVLADLRSHEEGIMVTI